MMESRGAVKAIMSDEMKVEKVRPKVIVGAPRTGMSLLGSERLLTEIVNRDILTGANVNRDILTGANVNQDFISGDTHFAQQIGDAYIESVISDIDDVPPSKHPKSRRKSKSAEARKRIKRQRKQKHR